MQNVLVEKSINWAIDWLWSKSGVVERRKKWLMAPNSKYIFSKKNKKRFVFHWTRVQLLFDISQNGLTATDLLGSCFLQPLLWLLLLLRSCSLTKNNNNNHFNKVERIECECWGERRLPCALSFSPSSLLAASRHTRLPPFSLTFP